MKYVKLVRAGDTNYMHTSSAWLTDVRRFNLTDCMIIDVQDEVTDDWILRELDAGELTLTDERTITWMGEAGGYYSFYACGGDVKVWQHEDGTFWCTEQDSEHYFAF